MNALRLRFITAATLLLAVLLTPANIFPCAISSSEPVFTLPDGPDSPLELFAKGRLGILLPGYDREYLVVAYRYLAGPPLSPAEEESLIAAWTPKMVPGGDLWREGGQLATWERARSAALGLNGVAKVDISPYRQFEGAWEEYPNCGADAFTTAAETVTNLAGTLGSGSPPVRDWVAAQDTVFRNCHGSDFVPSSQSPAYIPPPATMQNAVLRMDRDYQIAAANFYAGNWQTAAQQFQQIAGDRESPWRTWAPYLVARCYIRQATLGTPGERSFNAQDMTAAEQRLQAILHDPAQSKIHPATQRLLNYVVGRLHPDQRLHEVAQELAGRAPAPDFAQDLIDFNWLLKRRFARAEDGTVKPTSVGNAPLGDLTDWVLTFQQQGPAADNHAFERWKATKSQAWLMAALSMAKGKDADASALAQAAAAIAPSSPAYQMAVYYRARLLAEQEKPEATRQLLDANLPRFEKGPLSSLNLLLAQRLAVAANFHQFLEFAPRTPVEYGYYDCEDCGITPDTRQTKPLPKRLEGDSAAIFNQRLPLSILAEAATGTALPSELRAHIATATWARAAIVGDASVAKAVEAPTAEAHPELRDYLKAYDAANSEDSRSFAATWTMLHFPGMQPFIQGGGFRETRFVAIDDFRDNWWCGNQFPSKVLPPNTISYGNGPPIDPATGKQAVPVSVVPLPFPSFLTAAERASAGDQIRKLSTLAAAPEYMGSIVLQWAKDHPTDQRVPEALHLVVRATRYGCSGDKAGQISKAAYDLLHTHYPASPWTKQTPYWFK